MSLPHSNADSERVFSAIRRIQTEFWASMDISLLENLVIVKTHMLSRNECCYSKEFTDDFLSRAKSATYHGLNQNESDEQDDPVDDLSGEVLCMISGAEPSHANKTV